MNTIYKYTPYRPGTHSVWLPLGAKILSAGWQNGSIVIWSEVNVSNNPTCRIIAVYGTGWDMSDCDRKFISTVQDPDGFVWHVFEEFP